MVVIVVIIVSHSSIPYYPKVGPTEVCMNFVAFGCAEFCLGASATLRRPSLYRVGV